MCVVTFVTWIYLQDPWHFSPLGGGAFCQTGFSTKSQCSWPAMEGEVLYQFKHDQHCHYHHKNHEDHCHHDEFNFSVLVHHQPHTWESLSHHDMNITLSNHIIIWSSSSYHHDIILSSSYIINLQSRFITSHPSKSSQHEMISSSYDHHRLHHHRHHQYDHHQW